MMKNFKKLLSLLLVALLLISATIVPAYAAKEIDPSAGTTQKLQSVFYQVLDKMVSTLVKVLNALIPGLNWTGKIPSNSNYQTVDFYPGENVFDNTVQTDSKWSLGFASASLLEGLDILNGKYYMAGSLEPIKGRAATEIYDDQMVKAFAISDGTSGTMLYAVLDGYGFARGDVLEIRNRLSEFAQANNIISINISVLHQHSCVDILGLAAPLLSALIKNPAMCLLNKNNSDFVGGKNTDFMNNLYKTVTDTMINAFNNMNEGSLYFGTVDVSDYIRDKRNPIVFDGNLNRLRFVPDNKDINEIWICEFAIHCVGLGVSTSKLTSDFPYYLSDYVKEQTGADVICIEGAELALTTDYTNVIYDENCSDIEKIKAMGETLGALTMSITNDTELSPIMNIKIQEVTIPATNEILVLAVREGLANSVITTDGLQKYNLISEIGYLELGNQLGILLSPGETAPEILYGGVTEASKTWTGEEWNFAPLEQTANIKLICFGLCNDQIGYIIPDNDFRSMFTQNEEITASSNKSASTIAKAFEEIINSVK